MKKGFFHIALFVCILIPFFGYSQDIHFSQFQQAPARLNPALTGQFIGGYRIAGIYRSQWSSVTVPYSTVAFSGDAHNFMRVQGLGAGLDLFYDQAGDGNLGTFNINLSGSYTLKIGEKKKNNLTLGGQFGWVKKQIDPSQLVFDNNYFGTPNEAFDPGLSYLDISTGALWHRRNSDRKSYQIGVALHHLTTPNVSWFGNGETELPMRITLHGNYQFPVSDKIDLIPAMLVMFQGPHQQFTPGMDVKYILDSRSSNYRAVYLGAYTRIQDAAFLRVGMDWNTWNFGLSYDVNYSSLNTASRYRGGFEISVIYIMSGPLPPRKKFKTCPDYL